LITSYTVSCKGLISSKESRKEPRALFLISKDGKTISLSDDGDGNNSGIGSNVAVVMLKDASINGDKITARVYYYDDEGDITLTPVKEK